MTIYIESITYWWNNAPIFGLGADGYRHLIPAIGDIESIAHPHSVIIQLLLSYGILGLLIPSYFFFLLSWKIFKSNNKQTKVIYLTFLSTMILSIFDGVLYHAYGLFISTIIAGICIARAWPLQHTNLITSNRSILKQSLILTLSLILVLTSSYYLLFTYQLYNSKYVNNDEQWINWNAEYPLYFSPTWTYQRYKIEDIEKLKTMYIKQIHLNQSKLQNRINNETKKP